MAVVRNLGAPLGIRSALSAGAAGSGNVQNEVAAIQRDAVHVLIGTPAKLNEVITARGVVGGSDCRLLIVSWIPRACSPQWTLADFDSLTKWINSSLGTYTKTSSLSPSSFLRPSEVPLARPAVSRLAESMA
jgi:hypothetical protein